MLPTHSISYTPVNNDGEDDVETVDQSFWSNTRNTIYKHTSDLFKKETLIKRFPICQWLPSYRWSTLFHDLVAGFTVGLTAIPQGIAYAVVAGLPPQYGLYSGFMGAFVYIFFGSCKDVTIGPTAILALITRSFVTDNDPDLAVLSSFLTGCIIFLFGLLNLGFLIDFISMPITSGFTSAAAITIASSQIKNLLGLSGQSKGFLGSWIDLMNNIKNIKLWDTILGSITILVLLTLRLFSKLNCCQVTSNSSDSRKLCRNVLTLLTLASNAIVAVIGTLLGYAFYNNGNPPFNVTGPITGGLPPFEPPPFSSVYGNRTYTFSDMATVLGSSIIVIPVISVLEIIAVAKAFSNNKDVDATQEMIALGCCNIAGSFVRAMPVTGSFTRTAINHVSGVKTPLGGIATGCLVLLALVFLTAEFCYIPKATLAGIIIIAVLFMVDLSTVHLLWRTKRMDLIPLSVTFASCLLLNLEYGILIGIGISILFLLHQTARPPISLQQTYLQENGMIIIAPQQSLAYPSASYIRSEVIRLSLMYSAKIVVLDGALISTIDGTIAKMLITLKQDIENQDGSYILWRWNDHVQQCLLGVDKDITICFKHYELPQQILDG